MNNFLASVERRAYRMAYITTGNREEALDESANNLDADTLVQLRACRNRALAGELQSARTRWQWGAERVGGIFGSGDRFVPAAYLMTPLAVVLVIGSFWFSRPAELQDVSALGNLGLVSAGAAAQPDEAPRNAAAAFPEAPLNFPCSVGVSLSPVSRTVNGAFRSRA